MGNYSALRAPSSFPPSSSPVHFMSPCFISRLSNYQWSTECITHDFMLLFFNFVVKAFNIVHPLQSNNRSGLETFYPVFCFYVFVFSGFVFCAFVFVWADFYVSVCVNGFIIFLLTNIFVSVSVNKNHTELSLCVCFCVLGSPSGVF